jgi:ornithine cyclodeaminase/alanine dehydrogenase-like protein (mu-crystallin family)
MTLILHHEQMVGLLEPDEIIAAVRSGLNEQADGHVQLPSRTTVDSNAGHGWLRIMPAILNGSGVMGYKAMHSTPGVGVRYVVSLYDLLTGEFLVQMDADWLTVQRTAATAALAADELSNDEIGCCAVLGSSGQSRAMLAAVARIRTPAQVKVFSPTPGNRRRFADEMSKQLNLPITPVESAQQAVEGSDLVLSIYRAGTTPGLAADWVAPGAHINACSSVRPEARELEDDVWRRSSLIVVDDREHIFESGDGISALKNGATGRDEPVELWQLVGGMKPGRQSDSDITLFKAVGTALQDLSVALAIYRRARERGLGVEIGDFPHLRAIN